MKSLPETLADILKRIRDERLLWLAAILVLAIISGIRDQLIFIAVLVVGGLVIIISLFVSQRSRIPLAITFKDPNAVEVEVPEVQVEISKCEFELRNGDNKLKKAGDMAFKRGMGGTAGWECYLPKEAMPEDIIRLVLTDRDGHTWETGPFSPVFPNKKARRVK